MFKFNFNGSNENTHETDENKVQWLQSEKVEPKWQLLQQLDTIAKHAKMFACGEVEIGHVQSPISIESLGEKDNIINLVEKEHSDLIPGKYEGGLKIWECTYDLIQYLEDNEVAFEDKNVLDLGCGTGILGIYAFQKNATVTFQDYNKEILEHITIPNVALNIEDEDMRQNEVQKCMFYSGDWESFNNLLSPINKYDVILTSETIYNINNYDKLIKLFENRLGNNGVVYLAAKTYYFGVGGGTRQFEKALKKSDKLKYDVVWKTTDGIQREIIEIKRI